MDYMRAADFAEIADRVWVARHEWFDINVTAIAGEAGLVVIDTLASERAARAAIESLARVSSLPVVAVVNTHEHFDHVLGNRTFREFWPAARLVAHATAAERTCTSVTEAKRNYSDSPEAPGRDEVLATEPLAADSRFVAAHVVDLGDRSVEIIHPGLGHTAGDAVIVVPDVDVVVAGDLIEQSDEREDTPGFGLESHPLEWPGTLDFVLQLIGEDTVVVPGHGGRVDRDFVISQRDRLGVLAQTVIDLAAAGSGLRAILDHKDWPFPRRYLESGIRAAYAQLPANAKRLPLV